MDVVFPFVELAQRELLLFGAFWLILGGLDDVLIDAIWLIRRIYRRFTYYRDQPPLRADQIPAPQNPGTIAVFVPTWREAAVIGTMLHQCRQTWKASDVAYRLYVGCYANDPEGIDAIQKCAAEDPLIRMVITSHDGPTTKADCLNHLWHNMVADELAGIMYHLQEAKTSRKRSESVSLPHETCSAWPDRQAGRDSRAHRSPPRPARAAYGRPRQSGPLHPYIRAGHRFGRSAHQARATA